MFIYSNLYFEKSTNTSIISLILSSLLKILYPLNNYCETLRYLLLWNAWHMKESYRIVLLLVNFFRLLPYILAIFTCNHLFCEICSCNLKNTSFAKLKGKYLTQWPSFFSEKVILAHSHTCLFCSHVLHLPHFVP